MAITIVLVRPEVAGNVGAVARLMGNFGVSRLVLVAPQCNHLSKEAVDRAKHNKQLLKEAKVVKSLKDVKADTLVGTTCRTGNDFNLPRSPLLPKQLAEAVPASADVALVFGPEGPGLANAELLQCDFAVTVPTTKQYAAMNLSHAVAIVLYELHAAAAFDHVAVGVTQVNAAEKKQLLKLFDECISRFRWKMIGQDRTQRRVWSKVVGKAFLTRREAFAMMGFLRHVEKMQVKKSSK